ncbi:MAG TPA: RNA 2',3'-cyclic phosphodiesterase [Calditrichaeota bacterium]|nr:RNA 2',3'-cyclic phosphodiesterase [Calditrichota bacterium]
MNATIRCFFAIELPADLKDNLHRFISGLKTQTTGVKWVKSGSLLITLKFLGEQAANRVDTLVTALSGQPLRVASFDVQVGGFGAFPTQYKPRVFWIGVESLPRSPLYSLFEQLEERLEPLGFEKESRRFSPHLTLGRVKTRQSFESLWQWAEANPFEKYRFTVNSFSLMQSILKPSGAEYHTLQKYPLHAV